LLSANFPGMDIVEVSIEAFGKWVATIIAIIFAAYFLLDTAGVMRQFTENVISTVLPNTPILFVEFVFILAVGYITHCGLEGICRTAYFTLPILIVGTIGLCILTINWWHPLLLFPFWGTGINQILYGSFRYSSIFANVLLLCVIYPHAHNPKAFRAIGTTSILISTLLLVCFIVTYHMVFPATETGKSSFPLYQLARMVYLGRFIQRLESIFVFLWVTSAIVKMAVTLWGASYLLGKALNWPTSRPSVPILGLLSFAISMWAENVMDVLEFNDKYMLGWGWIIVFGLPLIIVISGAVIHNFRPRKGRRPQNA